MNRHKYLKGEKAPDPENKRIEAALDGVEKRAEKLGVNQEIQFIRDEIRRRRAMLEEERERNMDAIRQRRAMLDYIRRSDEPN
jgi:nucleotide-binding universal stress UspA family protein